MPLHHPFRLKSNILMKVAECVLKSKKITEGSWRNNFSGSKPLELDFWNVGKGHLGALTRDALVFLIDHYYENQEF